LGSDPRSRRKAGSGPAPEDPQRTHPWRDTVKREVREGQEKNKDTLLFGPMDEAQADADPEVGGLKRSNIYVLLVLQLAVGMA
jgi:hypothetical protein